MNLAFSERVHILFTTSSRFRHIHEPKLDVSGEEGMGAVTHLVKIILLFDHTVFAKMTIRTTTKSITKVG